MCDAQTLKLLEETVKSYLDEKKMFTGYDITIETRSRNNIWLKHEDVHNDVHEISILKDALNFGWSSQGQSEIWKKAQVTMPSGEWAWVYHPASIDPSTYSPKTKRLSSLGQFRTPVLAASPAPNNLVSKNPVNKRTDGTFVTDYRNRLLIPTKYLRDAGLVSGDTVCVFVSSSAETIMICKDSNALQNDGVKITTQIVERDGEIRLSSKTLKAADIKGNKFVIENSDKQCNGSLVKVVEVKELAVASTTGN